MTLFVLACVALMLFVLGALGVPLVLAARTLPQPGQFDRVVYRDQLNEIDRDVTRGVLSPAEASSARLEIQRRLLAVDAKQADMTALRSTRSPRVAAAIALFIVAAGGALYWRLGAPTLPDSPFGAAPPPQTAAAAPGAPAPTPAPHIDMKAAADKLEAKLRADPTNAEGWVLYARTESTLGDWSRAMNAYRQAINLGQKGADVFAGYGEMLVLAAQGVVAPQAREAFVAARDADPKNDVARFYLALADAQAGDVRKAITEWSALATDIPDPSAMRDEIARRVADAAQSAGIKAPDLPKGVSEPPPDAAPGPTADQMAAAAQMPPAERDKLVGDMIAQLAAKLKNKPDDLDGWLRLGRAYAVQGDSAKAVDAYDHAIKLKPDDAAIKLQAVGALLSPLHPTDALPPRAVELLHQVSATVPDAPEVLWYLGVIASRDGRPQEARQNWTKLLTKLQAGGEDYKMVQAALSQLTTP